MEIKDSGTRREFPTGAVRDMAEGKGRCDLLPLDVVANIMADNSLNEQVIQKIERFMQSGESKYLYLALYAFTLEAGWNIEDMLLDVAQHFEAGAEKYGEHNWQKGLPVKSYMDSAIRHYLKWVRDDDDEPHDRAVCWNIICAIWTCHHKPELNEYGKGD